MNYMVLSLSFTAGTRVLVGLQLDFGLVGKMMRELSLMVRWNEVNDLVKRFVYKSGRHTMQK